EQQLNETIMISLRTREGIDLQKIETLWGENEKRRLQNDLSKHIRTGLVTVEDQQARLTDEGMLRADGIAADLFV
ncbi:MAG: coproporphyrinogen III oxidase, partial [Chitinophagaceae bacterium]